MKQGVYDSDFLSSKEKNRVLRSILESGKKIDVLIAPAGAGKTSLFCDCDFVKSASSVENFDCFVILSASAKSKKSDTMLTDALSKIIHKANVTKGCVSYLHVNNFELKNRRNKRIQNGSIDNRAKTQLIGTKYSPLNQYDFISKIKMFANNFKLIIN